MAYCQTQFCEQSFAVVQATRSFLFWTDRVVSLGSCRVSQTPVLLSTLPSLKVRRWTRQPFNRPIELTEVAQSEILLFTDLSRRAHRNARVGAASMRVCA